ncbi:MAG: TolB family protein, partial [Vicinamibacterales bacterium]
DQDHPRLAGPALCVGDLQSVRTCRLLTADMLAGVAAPDHVLFVRQETLLAQRLDLGTLELIGVPFAVSERVERDPVIEFRAAVSASAAGPMAYRAPATVRRHLIWLDRTGRQTATLGEFETSTVSGALRVSPDGQVVSFVRQVNGQTDVWLMETARGVLRRFTPDTAPDSAPVWSPDGTRVAFDSNRRGVRDLYQRAVNGAGTGEPLLESTESKNLYDWSSDGRFLVFTNLSPTSARDLWVLPLDGDRKPSFKRVMKRPRSLLAGQSVD